MQGLTCSRAAYVTHSMPRMGCSAKVVTPAKGISLLLKPDSP